MNNDNTNSNNHSINNNLHVGVGKAHAGVQERAPEEALRAHAQLHLVIKQLIIIIMIIMMTIMHNRSNWPIFLTSPEF